MNTDVFFSLSPTKLSVSVPVLLQIWNPHHHCFRQCHQNRLFTLFLRLSWPQFHQAVPTRQFLRHVDHVWQHFFFFLAILRVCVKEWGWTFWSAGLGKCIEVREKDGIRRNGFSGSGVKKTQAVQPWGSSIPQLWFKVTGHGFTGYRCSVY